MPKSNKWYINTLKQSFHLNPTWKVRLISGVILQKTVHTHTCKKKEKQDCKSIPVSEVGWIQYQEMHEGVFVCHQSLTYEDVSGIKVCLKEAGFI